jgi:hypothetical protein
MQPARRCAASGQTRAARPPTTSSPDTKAPCMVAGYLRVVASPAKNTCRGGSPGGLAVRTCHREAGVCRHNRLLQLAAPPSRSRAPPLAARRPSAQRWAPSAAAAAHPAAHALRQAVVVGAAVCAHRHGGVGAVGHRVAAPPSGDHLGGGLRVCVCGGGGGGTWDAGRQGCQGRQVLQRVYNNQSGKGPAAPHCVPGMRAAGCTTRRRTCKGAGTSTPRFS